MKIKYAYTFLGDYTVHGGLFIKCPYRKPEYRRKPSRQTVKWLSIYKMTRTMKDWAHFNKQYKDGTTYTFAEWKDYDFFHHRLEQYQRYVEGCDEQIC